MAGTVVPFNFASVYDTSGGYYSPANYYSRWPYPSGDSGGMGGGGDFYDRSSYSRGGGGAGVDYAAYGGAGASSSAMYAQYAGYRQPASSATASPYGSAAASDPYATYTRAPQPAAYSGGAYGGGGGGSAGGGYYGTATRGGGGGGSGTVTAGGYGAAAASPYGTASPYASASASLVAGGRAPPPIAVRSWSEAAGLAGGRPSTATPAPPAPPAPPPYYSGATVARASGTPPRPPASSAPPPGGRRLYLSQPRVRSIAAPGKASGEDAFFVSPSGVAAGVADGVGAWKLQGIDAGQYSRGLMDAARDFVASVVASGGANTLSPLPVLEHAFTTCARAAIVGTSTALVLVLEPSGVLRMINVGDSVCMVVRGAQLLYRTNEQQHSFNCPFQLGTNSFDKPSMGEHHSCAVAEGDIVLLFSDGVCDNVHDAEIVQAVAAAAGETDAVAHGIAVCARSASLSRTARTPFAAAAQRVSIPFQGGKADDITVVAMRVSSTLVP